MTSVKRNERFRELKKCEGNRENVCFLGTFISLSRLGDRCHLNPIFCNSLYYFIYTHTLQKVKTHKRAVTSDKMCGRALNGFEFRKVCSKVLHPTGLLIISFQGHNVSRLYYIARYYYKVGTL